MTKKKKKKISNRKIRDRKTAQKNKSRRKLMLATTKQVMNMRKSMRKGDGIDVGGDNKLLGLDDMFDDSQCDGVGDCCFNHNTMLDHADVYRIVNNERVKELYDIQLTTDLCEGPENRSLLHYWIDTKSGAPMCFVRRDDMEDKSQRCVFLVEEDGKMECLLGEDRPTVCLANPLRRVAEAGEDGKMKAWKYLTAKSCAACSKCVKNSDEKFVQSKVEDHVSSRVSEGRYKSSELYHGFCGWLSKTVKPEPMKKLATMMIFDFDRFSVDIGMQTPEKAIESRPEPDKVDSLLSAAYGIIEGARGKKDEDIERDTEEK
jgi:hypothetical protein